MSIHQQLGIPIPDKDGTFKINCEEKDGVVTLTADGHPFVKCLVKGGSPVVQVVDCDSGVRFERSIAVLCWRR